MFHLTKNYNPMKYAYYIVAVIMIIGWAIAVFVYDAESFIHVILVVALLIIFFRIVKGNRKL